MSKILSSLLGLGLLLSSQTQAVDHVWIGAVNDIWTTAGNWSTGQVPGAVGANSANDFAVFNGAGPHNVFIPDGPSTLSIGGIVANAPGYTIINELDTGPGSSGLFLTQNGITGNSPLSFRNRDDGDLLFSGNSGAGNSILINEFALVVPAIGFTGNSSAQNARLVILGGGLQFFQNATAGFSSIFLHNNAGLELRENATAGFSSIFLHNTSFMTALQNATAGFSSLFLNDDSLVNFSDNASAGFSSIVARDNASVVFFANSSAENASINLADVGASLLLQNMNIPLKLGSLTGLGFVFPVSTNATLEVGFLGRDETFSGPFFDSGPAIFSLTKKGAGAFTVTDQTHSYTGDTHVDAGTLVWNGDFIGFGTSNFFVEPGATLRGIGRIQGDIISRGKLYPGDAANPFGVLRLAGNFEATTVNSTSPSEFCCNVAGSRLHPSCPLEAPVYKSNQLDCSGGADFENLNFRVVQVESARYLGFASTVLKTGAGIVGTFATSPLQNVYPLLSAQFSKEGNNIVLRMNELPFLQDALLPLFNENETEVARALDGARAHTRTEAACDPNVQRLFGEINLLSRENLRDALNRLYNHSVDLNEAASRNQWTAQQFINANYETITFTDLAAPFVPTYATLSDKDSPSAYRLARKGMSLRDSAFQKTSALSQSGFTNAALVLEDRLGVHHKNQGRKEIKQNSGHGHLWFQGFGNRGHGEKTFQTPAYQTMTAGVMMGFDYQVYDDLRLGVGGGYRHTNTEIDVSVAHYDTKAPFGSFWGLYSWGCTDFEFGFMYQHDENRGKRYVIVNNFNAVAQSKYDGYDFLPHFAVAHNLWVCDALHIRPIFAIDMIFSHTDKMREFGGLAANLNADSYKSSYLQTSLGASFDRHLCWSHGLVIPSLEFRYVNFAQMKLAKAVNSFASFPTATFVTTAHRDNRSYFELGAGISQEWHSGANFSLRYQGRYGERENSHTALISIGKKW